MKNILFRLSVLLMVISGLMTGSRVMASPVDSLTARKAAIHFYNWKTGRSVPESAAQLAYRQNITENGVGELTEEVCAIYVFNVDGHFVMMSADSRVLPVLGYSTESAFIPDNIPEPIQDWMNDYAEEIRVIMQELSDEECEPMITEWNRLLNGDMPMQEALASAVAPLLNTTWNQNYPYNSMCPADAGGSGGHAYAGCVACAMAQIIRYWNYPSTGLGSHSYYCDFTYQGNGYGNYGTLSANFGAATYNFSLMPNSLNGASQEQINEVAQLMYHCGVAVDMMYGPNGSGAYDGNAATAFRTYFGYDDATIIYKTYGGYTDAAWLSVIKGELDNLRPVYYSGQGSGGHAFVCDGYDDQNYLHFNWGWSGSYNGYFAATSLTPGSHNYSNSNSAIIGVSAANPVIHPGTRHLTFLTEMNTISESKPVTVLTNHLSGNISAVVTGNFKISTNNSSFNTSLTMGSNGGTLYVRYHPTISTGTEYGYVVLTSGTLMDTIMLTGVVYNATPNCLPPANLIVSSQNLQDISLQWELPSVPSNPHTLTWSTNSNNLNYGLGTDYKNSMLHRYCDTDLVAYHNQALTSITFYARSGITVCKAVVYKGGHFEGGINPGTLVLSQDIDINTLSMGTWNTVTLNTPVVVDATQELWFGIYIEAPGGSYCVPMSSRSVPRKGAIYGTHSGNSVSWEELYENYSFCIKGTVDNVRTVASYDVSRNGTHLATTTETSYQDHVSSTNTYQYTVTANWINGCSASAQKSYTNVVSIIATPDRVDFFANDGYGVFVKKVMISGNGVTADIQATVSGNFLISTDSVNFLTSATLPAAGGNLYVKYVPVSSTFEYETGQITLVSGNVGTTVPLSGQNSEGCNPPQNLVLSQSGSTVGLSWNAPAGQVITQQPLTWFENLAMAFGTSGNIQRYLVQRFDINDLAPYHGKILTAVSFIPHASATSYRIVVYKGGGVRTSTYLTSGTQVVDQNVDISTLTIGAMNTIALNTPVTIDASQELWYGIYLEAPSGSYPIYVGTPYVAKKGIVSRTASTQPNSWTEYLANSGYANSYCFALNATIEDAPLTLTHYQIDRNDEYVGETNNTTYNDQPIFNGDYEYSVLAFWNNGCRAAVRGTITVTGLCDPTGQSFSEEACDSFLWNGTTYTESGDYSFQYMLPGGCPAVDTLHLTVYHSTHNVETVTDCESYTWHGQTYSTTGIYTYAYNNADGCASVDTLKLTINHGTHNVETKTVCEKYVWHGQAYSTSGVYTYSYNNTYGCASVDTLKLTVNHGTHNVDIVTACDSYIWYGQTFNESGVYTYPYHNANGCPSVDTLKLTIKHSSHNVETETSCEMMEWYGQLYTQSGAYTYEYNNSDGCPSVDTLHVTIYRGTYSSETVSACEGYDWHGSTYTYSGTFTYMYNNEDDCESVDTLYLTINYPTFGDTTAVACESFTWYGTTYTKSGDYLSHASYWTNAAGCDSTVTLHLTINHGTHNVESKTACESYIWHGTTYTQTDTYTYAYNNADGCASVDTLHLTINNPAHQSSTVIAYDTYTWTEGDGQTYTTSGDHLYTHADVNGCTQVDTLHLTVYYSSTSEFTAVACEFYEWDGQQYTATGDYPRHYTDIHGADSAVTLHLTINQPTTGDTTAVACESFTWYGTTYTQSGDYPSPVSYWTNAAGCDSTVTLHLTINHGTHNVQTKAACGSYNWHGVTYTASGTYTYDYNNTSGCASVDTLHLTINQSTTGDTTAVACESFTWYGETYTASGNYTTLKTNAAGCDSIVTLHLTINQPTSGDTTAVACESFTWYGTTYTKNGNYSRSLTNAAGCDSTVTLHLTINQPTTGDTTAVACESFTWYGTTYTKNGNYSRSLTNVNGCDSTVTLHLTINHGTHNVETRTACGSYNWHGTSYTTSGTYTYGYTNTSGCASVDTLHLMINQPTTGDTTAVACVNFTWYGTTYTASGNYTTHKTNAAGCDSTVTLHLTINQPTIGDTTAVACESFTWYGTTYTASGNYTTHKTNAAGCDSIVTLHLTINQPTTGDTTAVACESFTWYGTTYTASGNYTTHKTNAAGCDSTVTLHLTINHGTHNVETAIACESYTWHGTTYTQSGTYEYEYTNTSSCPSVDTLKLTINNPVHLSYTVTAYDNYTWTTGNGQTYTTSGTYTYSHADVNNCTQVDTLHLTVYYSSATEITEEACESYEWDGVTYTESGYYPRHYTDIHGADSLVTLLLTINHGTHNVETVVECGSYTWHGTTYTQSGTYEYEYTNANSCPSVDTLKLTINNPVHLSYTVTAYDSYTWTTGNGQTYTTSGIYTYSHADANNCTQVDTLHLTVYYSSATEITEEACESYEWDGVTYTESGYYPRHYTDIHGADSLVTLLLTINQPTSGDTMAVACESFTWYGTTYTASGNYTTHKTNAAGCDSTVTLHLTINQPTSGDTMAVACESFTWYGTTYTTSGNYAIHKTNVAGCDSTVILHLTINQPTTGDTMAVACENFTWYGTTYTASGDYTIHKTNVAGCDSTLTLHLTINQPTVGDTTAVSCESFTWYGTTYTTSGNYTTLKTNVAGCDSTLTLHLTINQPTSGDTTAVACENFTWYGAAYTTSGNYTTHKTNVAGCDSTVTLHLTINQPTSGDTAAVACESFTWYGTTYTASGDYTTLKTNAVGCDSTLTLHLIINQPTSGDTTAVACESFTWYGTTYTASGDYTIHKTNAVGCDSTVTLHLTINQPTVGDTTAVACENFTWYGTTYTTSGNYTIHKTNAAGCDSTVTLHLTINQPTTGDTTAVACESFTWYGATYTTSGNYTTHKTNVAGCDSTVTLHLTINPVFNTPISVAICDGSSYDFFGQTLTTAGTYTHTLQSVSGCDSVITLTLTVNPVFNTPVSAAICDGSNYDFFGQTLTTAGTYTYTLQSISGCDSIITLTLTVNDVFNTPISAAICDGSSYDFFGQTLTTAGTYTHTLQSISGCDSIITLTLTVNPVFNTPISAAICDGSSYDFFGQTLTTAGIYTHTLQSISGCDSIITLTLTVNPIFNTPISAAICDGSSYDFFGQTLTTAGTYTHTLQSISGCDSIITLTLTVNPIFNTPISAAICDGSSYDFFGQTLTAAGTYTHTLQSVSGCDSVITLTLTVNSADVTEFTETACEEYVWNNETFTVSGDYTRTFTNVAGCDSTVTLHLTVNYGTHNVETETACESCTWHGETYNQSGTYTYTYTNGNGCASVDTLHLTINYSATTDFSISTADSCYEWNMVSYCETGDYTQTLQTVDGCDSVVTLHLTITVGIDDHDLSGIDVFPNPTNGILNIKGDDIHQILIYNADGQLVYASDEWSANLKTMDVSSYAAGQYFVKIIFGNKQTVTKKVIVNRK